MWGGVWAWHLALAAVLCVETVQQGPSMHALVALMQSAFVHARGGLSLVWVGVGRGGMRPCPLDAMPHMDAPPMHAIREFRVNRPCSWPRAIMPPKRSYRTC